MSANPPPRGFRGRDVPSDAALQRCVQCGLCLPTCPTYLETQRETSSPRGRIHLIAAVAQGRLDVLSPGFVAQMHQCLDCRACETACPSGVEYGSLVESARAQIRRAQGGPSARGLLLDGIFGDMRRFRLAATTLRRYQRSGTQRATRASGILRAMGLSDAESLVPPIPARFFIPQNQRYHPIAPTERPSIAIFAGCVMSTIFAETDRALIRVLTALGWPVIAPADQGCCGALATHAGEPDRARALAKRNIAAFEASGAALIVNNAAGCGSAIKEYGHLLTDEPDWAERAARFSERVRDVSELLADALDAPMRVKFELLPLAVTYQDPCHLAHAQRITQQPRRLLEAIPGLEVIEMAESALCCGSAGVYNLTQPEMAGRLQQRKVANTTATSADLVVTANPGCFLQLRAGLRRAGSTMGVIHLVDLLDASLRGLSVEDVRQIAAR